MEWLDMIANHLFISMFGFNCLFLSLVMFPLSNKIENNSAIALLVVILSMTSIFSSIAFLDSHSIKAPVQSFLYSVSEKRVTKVFVEKQGYWKRNDDQILISYAPITLPIAIRFEPISPIPDVRKLSYSLNIFVPLGSVEKALEFREFEKNHEKIDKTVKYWLYEFNQQYGKTFIQFYNPEDNWQQEKFKDMLLNYLDEEINLASVPYKIEDVSFTL